MSRQSRRTPAWRKHRLLAAAGFIATTHASLLSAPFDALRRRGTAAQAAQLLAGTPTDSLAAPFSNATAAQPTVVSSQPHLGRYGHSAVYLPPPSNTVLIIGGQVGTEGTAITSDVLQFRVASTFVWGDGRPADSAIPDNPIVDPVISSGLPASAWSAATYDLHTESTWLFGGVVPECETDSLVHTLPANLSSAWSTASLSPRAPPRRRQATAVPVTNSTTGGTDIWVLGGIADQFTCSVDTIGYVGLDRYDTLIGSVESMAWNAPSGFNAVEWQAPVSDYSATLLHDGVSIAVIGGQTAMGDLVHLDAIPVFDVLTRTWAQKAASGEIPSPRMGHSAVLLPSGSVLIFGGLSPNHAVLSDLQLLNPLTYTWTRLVISDASLTSPALAYHTATLVEGGTIIVAFGLDGQTGTPSNQFWFLTIDEISGTYTWQDTFDGNGAEAASAIAKRSRQPIPKLARRGQVFAKKAVEFVPNPKAEASEAETSATAVSVDDGWDGATAAAATATTTSQAPAVQAAPASLSSSSTSSSSAAHYTPPFASSASASAARASTSPQTLPATSKSSDNASSSSSTSTIIGASVGAIGGALALVGLAFYFIRRRAVSSASGSTFRGPMSPNMAQSGGNGDPNAPFVSQLLFTRPSQARNLSLGSTAPAFSPRDMDSDLYLPDADASSPGGGAEEAEDMAGVGSRGLGLGVVQDPFADKHRVNEVGQLERSGSGSSSMDGNVGADGPGAGQGTGVGAALQASVRSIPFLSSISRLSSSTSPSPGTGGDSFTQAAPTLASRGSIRRPRASASQQRQADIPTPGTPAELIGMAITSDDGHDALPYLMVSSPSETSHDGASAGHNAAAAAAAPVKSAPGQIPAILRPGTPLRVANPDPFADQ
ncbi:hypothetical protein JCM10908_007339 [Rhodotorula pacifica]|uniref:uncharacterized protein n=1 Tax=Rhodotorula pacifica TaxID=1495444 RepID=UPI00317A54B8